MGFAGDRVVLRYGVVFVNGERRKESYVNYRLTDSTFFGPVKVPEGSVFAIGDNRSDARDPRDYGPVSENDLLDQVLALPEGSRKALAVSLAQVG